MPQKFESGTTSKKTYKEYKKFLPQPFQKIPEGGGEFKNKKNS